jgi:hypothetical protein
VCDVAPLAASPCKKGAKLDAILTAGVAVRFPLQTRAAVTSYPRQFCRLDTILERWQFTREPDQRGGYSWRWQRTTSTGGRVDNSLTAYWTLWECVKNATRAGFDANALPPSIPPGDIVVEIANPRKDS